MASIYDIFFNNEKDDNIIIDGENDNEKNLYRDEDDFLIVTDTHNFSEKNNDIKLSIEKKNSIITNTDSEVDKNTDTLCNTLNNKIKDLENKCKNYLSDNKSLNNNLQQLLIENKRLKNVNNSTNQNLPNSNFIESILSEYCDITIAISTENTFFTLTDKETSENIIKMKNVNYFNNHRLKRNKYFEFYISSESGGEIDLLILGSGINFHIINMKIEKNKHVKIPFLLPGINLY